MSDQAGNAPAINWERVRPAVPPKRVYDAVTVTCRHLRTNNHGRLYISFTADLYEKLGWKGVEEVVIFTAYDEERKLRLLMARPTKWVGREDIVDGDVFKLQTYSKGGGKSFQFDGPDWIPAVKMNKLTAALQIEAVAQGELIIELPRKLTEFRAPAPLKKEEAPGKGMSMATTIPIQKAPERAPIISAEEAQKSAPVKEQDEPAMTPMEAVLSTCSLLSASPMFRDKMLSVGTGHAVEVTGKKNREFLIDFFGMQERGKLYRESELHDRMERAGFEHAIIKDLPVEQILAELNSKYLNKVRLSMEVRDGYLCITQMRNGTKK